MSKLGEFYQGKKVLVTGHTGFKGSWLCLLLQYLGADVVGYSLPAPTKPSLYELLNLSFSIRDNIGDIRDFDSFIHVLESERPEIVIHLAAQPIVLDSYQMPRYTYETNVMGTVNVLEAIRHVDSVKSFVNVTTDKVYENSEVANHLFKEGERLDGFDPYSNSKSCSELVTACYRRSFPSMKTAISTARAGNVIGGGDFSPHRIMVDAVNAAINGEPIEVRNKNSVRPYQFVLEPLFVYLMIAASQYENPSFAGSYNVGPDKSDIVSTGKLMDIFCKHYGEGSRWIDASVNGAPHEAAFLALENTLLKKTFAWEPVMHIDEAIKWVVDWGKAYRDNKDLKKLMFKQIREFDERFAK